MTTLENNFLKVTVSSQGAELHSIFNKTTNTEHLWQAGPVWDWHAPNLFPVVGACLDNQLRVSGTNYEMQKHGFARNMDFRQIESTGVHAKFSLPFSDETLKVYPYKFEFQVLYDLFDSKLRISYKVINLDADAIWFSLGAHPAFNVPFAQGTAYEDYYLEFERTGELRAHDLSPQGYFTGTTREVPMDGNRLHLTRELFSKDALVLKDLSSRKVMLRNTKNAESLTVEFPHFNYLGIWAKPGADFVCIEPWLGCADTEGSKLDIRERDGAQCAEHGHVFEREICIEVKA